jgi:hypothetical protein
MGRRQQTARTRIIGTYLSVGYRIRYHPEAFAYVSTWYASSIHALLIFSSSTTMGKVSRSTITSRSSDGASRPCPCRRIFERNGSASSCGLNVSGGDEEEEAPSPSVSDGGVVRVKRRSNFAPEVESWSSQVIDTEYPSAYANSTVCRSKDRSCMSFHPLSFDIFATNGADEVVRS